MGKERILMTMEACGVEIPEPAGTDVFIAFMGDKAKAFALKLMHDLRLKGVAVQMDVMGRNFKNQFKFANRAGAAKTVIIGESELESGMLQIKDMESGEQTEVAIDNIIDELTK